MDIVRPGLSQRDVDRYAAQAEAGRWLANGEAAPQDVPPPIVRAGTAGNANGPKLEQERDYQCQ